MTDPSRPESKCDRARRAIESLLLDNTVLDEKTVGRLIADNPDIVPELEAELGKLQCVDAAMELNDQASTEEGESFRREEELAPSARIVIPGYLIEERIGCGGQALVFRAVQESTGQQVAIKVVHGGPLLSNRARRRLDREVGILAKLDHPMVVSIIDRGETETGSPYFVMPFIVGDDLHRWLEAYRNDHPPVGVPSQPSELLSLFVKICDAVNEAHTYGVVHRDLKPSNIRVDAKNDPHILDFGLARSSIEMELKGPNASVTTMTGQFIGSLPWASPEQAAGKRDWIDARTDVYALGVVLYEMLTGKFPYEVVGNIRDVLDNILTSAPISPSSLIEKQIAQSKRKTNPPEHWKNPINPVIEAIVLKTLSKDREDRYANAGALADEIRRYLAGEPTAARSADVGRTTGFRNPVAWVVTVLFCATALWLGAEWWPATREGSPHQNAVVQPDASDPLVDVPTRTVRGVVWLDGDRDGLRSEEEPGASDVTVVAVLKRDDKHEAAGSASLEAPSTTTRADGSYELDIPSGMKAVIRVRPGDEWIPTFPNSLPADGGDKPLDAVCAVATDHRTVKLFPLHPDKLPDLFPGEPSITLSPPLGMETDNPPSTLILPGSKGDLLVAWRRERTDLRHLMRYRGTTVDRPIHLGTIP